MVRIKRQTDLLLNEPSVFQYSHCPTKLEQKKRVAESMEGREFYQNGKWKIGFPSLKKDSRNILIKQIGSRSS